MLFKTLSASVYGIDAELVEIEVNLTPRPAESMQETMVTVVGLPDAAVRESRERIRAAINNSGFYFPSHRTTINLAPANVRKEGSAFDLPIAVGILGASGEVGRADLNDVMFVGELALDGRVRAIRGALPITVSAQKNGFRRLLIPAQNALEAGVVKNINVYPVNNLREVISLLNTETWPPPFKVDTDSLMAAGCDYQVDFQEVRGQLHAKRALEIASAGGHNVIMIGPPGSGKTMLAKRVPSILPPITFNEALETTKIHSVAGYIDGHGLLTTRPFRSPHHTISDAGLIGGGSIPRPGEVSLSHNGLLFLDELPEFDRGVLEVLRQPLEDQKVTISRAAMSVTFPANLMLIAAMNPCPCGFHGDPVRACRCSVPQIQRYMSKISGPLLDRIDIHISVPAIKVSELSSNEICENSDSIRNRVIHARKIQLQRLAGEITIFNNSQMSSRMIRKHCQLELSGKNMLEKVINKTGLSARAYDRILKVARTIADLEGADQIVEQHLSEAVHYRTLDRTYWI